jgi:hypothetical protein
MENKYIVKFTITTMHISRDIFQRLGLYVFLIRNCILLIITNNSILITNN